MSKKRYKSKDRDVAIQFVGQGQGEKRETASGGLSIRFYERLRSGICSISLKRSSLKRLKVSYKILNFGHFWLFWPFSRYTQYTIHTKYDKGKGSKGPSSIYAHVVTAKKKE